MRSQQTVRKRRRHVHWPVQHTHTHTHTLYNFLQMISHRGLGSAWGFTQCQRMPVVWPMRRL